MTVAEIVHERGPLTVAAFMDLALYDPDLGYYARAPRRSGRAGDFFTSVDVGPLFGELLAVQVAEMARLIQSPVGRRRPSLDLVEAGAGSGRLSADILRALRAADRPLVEPIELHLVDASAAARAAQRATLGPDLAGRLRSASSDLPRSIDGIVIANELLDALPVHQVVMRPEGLREIYVAARSSSGDAALRVVEGPPSTPALQEYLDRLGIALEPGWSVEINLRAVEWMRDVARRLDRGFVMLIDYGHDARQLYSASHSTGTLTTFSRHTTTGPADRSAAHQPLWLRAPGEQDITSHVDFTSVRAAAEGAGMTTLGFLDQTYFLMGLFERDANLQRSVQGPRARAFKTLMLPGGLGSTHKVLILGKNVGTPALAGCSFSMRVT